MSPRELLQQATKLLTNAGCDSPRLDAELLLMHAWGINKTALIIQMHEPVPDNVTQSFWGLLSRRQQREPIAYILGEKEFWSRPFIVDSNVLIPRPETEQLIEEVLKLYPDPQRPYRFCDIGTGSGCIACTLACEFPNAEVIATDISEAALNIARSNAIALHVADRITFKRGDMFSALEASDLPFNAIVSNPPYVSHEEMRAVEAELSFEPRGALTDESNGHTYLTILFDECRKWLKPEGHLIVETGICGLPPRPPHLYKLDLYDDLAGLHRGGVYRLKQDL